MQRPRAPGKTAGLVSATRRSQNRWFARGKVNQGIPGSAVLELILIAAPDVQSATPAKRSKTAGTANASAEGTKQSGNDVAKSQRQARAAAATAQKEAANEDVELGSSESDSGSDAGAMIEALDFSSEDEEGIRPTPAQASKGAAGEELKAVVQAAKMGKVQHNAAFSDGPGPNKDIEASSVEDRGVMYVGHLPNGFFEHEMRAYFSQFGTVTRLRVSRNKRSGKSKGYAFIEFESAEVCEIAAKTMDHYLLFGHILKCKVVPKDKVPERLWKGANRRFK
jgi:nucleolar protein 15